VAEVKAALAWAGTAADDDSSPLEAEEEEEMALVLLSENWKGFRKEKKGKKILKLKNDHDSPRTLAAIRSSTYPSGRSFSRKSAPSSSSITSATRARAASSYPRCSAKMLMKILEKNYLDP
jgi:hypothetical protein